MSPFAPIGQPDSTKRKAEQLIQYLLTESYTAKGVPRFQARNPFSPFLILSKAAPV